MNDSTMEMISTSLNGIRDLIIGMHRRVEALEKDSTEAANKTTSDEEFKRKVENIIEGYFERVSLSDFNRFDQDVDYRIEQYIENNEVVDQYALKDTIREIIKDADIQIRF